MEEKCIKQNKKQEQDVDGAKQANADKNEVNANRLIMIRIIIIFFAKKIV